jgi:hypothetical protein
MDGVNFIVSKDDVEKAFTIPSNVTIESLKEKIKELYNITTYIDIDFQIEKPMRVIGKFNVEPGILPRTFDRYELNKFGIKGEINLTFHLASDYTPFKNTSKTLNLKKYRENNEDKPLDKTTFNIESETEFPKLG